MAWKHFKSTFELMMASTNSDLKKQLTPVNKSQNLKTDLDEWIMDLDSMRQQLKVM
jgi:hypothetical protein